MMTMDKKNIMLVGAAGSFLIFISILMLVREGIPEKRVVTTTTTTATPVPNECLFSFMKRTDGAVLNFCFDRYQNEKLVIYCNGTIVQWTKDMIRSATKFLKRVFETLEPLENKGGYCYVGTSR